MIKLVKKSRALYETMKLYIRAIWDHTVLPTTRHK